jgi:hypothetical protein
METKDYKIGICCFSSKHAVWRRKSKDWLARNQGNVSQWGDMSTHGLLFQWSSTIKIQLSVLVWYKADLIVISLKINFFSPWYRWKIVEMALNNNHSLASDVQYFSPDYRSLVLLVPTEMLAFHHWMHNPAISWDKHQPVMKKDTQNPLNNTTFTAFLSFCLSIWKKRKKLYIACQWVIVV